jgi:hypothetical protein
MSVSTSFRQLGCDQARGKLTNNKVIREVTNDDVNTPYSPPLCHLWHGCNHHLHPCQEHCTVHGLPCIQQLAYEDLLLPVFEQLNRLVNL